MNNRKIVKLKKLATEFRQAILRTKLNFMNFESFPNGCCDDTSLLLAKYLYNSNFKSLDRITRIQYIHKPRFRRQTHTWLKYDKAMIIDITANQFNDINEPVIVTKNNNWYNKFEDIKIQKIEFTKLNSRIKNKLSNAYNKIISNL